MNMDKGCDQPEKPYIHINTVTAQRYDVFLDSEITEPVNYRELNSLLFNANEEDRFVLYINSPGGQLNSTFSIVEGLKNTPAQTVAILQGECYSAASMITMYCDEVLVLDSAHMMIHTANYGSIGNTGNVKAHTDFTTKQVENLIDKTYGGFLTAAEIERVKIGVELWFDADEIRERMVKRVEFLNAEYLRQEKEQEERENPKPKKPVAKKAAPAKKPPAKK
jgi:ATP-dependent protease ClpP protease subunit